MYKASVYNVSNIPSHLRHLLEEPAGAVLVIEMGDAVVNYFYSRSDGGLTEADLFEFAQEMQKAYLSSTDKIKPTSRECAFVAHIIAEEYREHGHNAQNPLQQKQFYNEARKYDDVCDRFLKNLVISTLLDSSGDVVSYYVKGDGGYAYSLNSSANSCTCHVGRNSTEICWHMRAVECYLSAIKRNERN